jgi:glycosyltransferase involved in cell wall biosynthesis
MPVPDLLTILVPVFNESGTVASVIDRLLTVDLPVPREIVVVNDGSSDGTQLVLDGMPGTGGVVRILHVERNAGKGAAIRLGLQHARGSIIAIQDADLELDPAQLAALVTPIVRGDAMVVYGSRFLAGRPDAPRLTILANRSLTLLTNVLFGARITDMETCYKIMRTDVARSLGLVSNRFDIEPEITAKLLPPGRRQEDRVAGRRPRAARAHRLPLQRLAAGTSPTGVAARPRAAVPTS